MNVSSADRVTRDGANQIRLPASLKTAGKILRPVLTIGEGKPARDYAADGPLRLQVPPSGMVVYEGMRAE